jgi:hypothetical protein
MNEVDLKDSLHDKKYIKHSVLSRNKVNHYQSFEDLQRNTKIYEKEDEYMNIVLSSKDFREKMKKSLDIITFKKND